MIPDILSAQIYVNTVASNYNKYKMSFNSNDPSTPIFNLKQISEYLKNQTVLCGVYDSDSTAFSLTFDDINNKFIISKGNVIYNNVTYSFAENRVNYSPVFATYSNSDYFIATIYVDVKTLINNKLTTFTLSQPAAIGDGFIYVREKSTLSSFVPPFKIQLDNRLIQIGSIDVYSGKLTFAASETVLSTAIDVDTQIYGIQEPIIGCSYTEPFSDSGDVFLSNHISKALVPEFTLRLYDVLMTNPSDPSVVTTGGLQQYKTNFINFYSQSYDSENAQLLSQSIDAFQVNLLQSQIILDLDSAINNFNSATQQYTLSGNISDFWLNTIMLQPEIISSGVDLGRYKKFDFPDEYLNAVNSFGTTSMYELLYAFDPAFYSNKNIYSTYGSVSNVSVNLLNNYGPASTFAPSLIVHGVSAVNNTLYPSGETPTTYKSTTQSVDTSSNNAFEIQFDSMSGSLFRGYNIYRKTVNNNLSVDLPLSVSLEVSGDTTFGSYLPSKPTSNSQNYQNFTGPYQILNTNGAQTKFAFEFKSRIPPGSLEDKVYVGGATVSLSISAAYSGNALIQALLVKPNPDLSTYTTLGTSDYMAVSRLTTTNTEYSFKFNQYTSGSLNLTDNTTYYVLLVISNTDSNNYSIYGYTTLATGSSIAQGFTGSWGNVANTAFNFKTLGFVDNLTNSQANIDSKLPLSNYVFRGIRQIRNKLTKPRSVYAYVPFFKLDSSGNKISTSLANDILVRLVGLNSTTGNVIDTGYVIVAKGTSSGAKVLLTGADEIDIVTYVSVEPGSTVDLDSNGQIIWGTYDYLLIIGDD